MDDEIKRWPNPHNDERTVGRCVICGRRCEVEPEVIADESNPLTCSDECFETLNRISERPPDGE